MERLTKRGTRKNGYVSAIGSGVGCWEKIIDRLAAYEDTGLEPNDVTDLMAAHGTAIGKLAEYRAMEEKRAPKCYSEDVGGGCRYLVNDGDDEPIAKCKRCPLCHVDKQRHQSPSNAPLTLEELREMDEGWIWIELLVPIYGAGSGYYLKKPLFSTEDKLCAGYPGMVAMEPLYSGYGEIWLAYRRKPEALGGEAAPALSGPEARPQEGEST